jgi:hypothetical protein
MIQLITPEKTYFIDDQIEIAHVDNTRVPYIVRKFREMKKLYKRVTL